MEKKSNEKLCEICKKIPSTIWANDTLYCEQCFREKEAIAIQTPSKNIPKFVPKLQCQYCGFVVYSYNKELLYDLADEHLKSVHG